MNAISTGNEVTVTNTGKGDTFQTATSEDIDRWDSLKLDDFAADFSKVDLPDRDMTPDELARAVDQFMSTLRQ